MDKREFLNRLQMQLEDLTNDERREALEYYEEYFADAGEENEADVLISLGSPEQVAEQIKAGIHKADEGMFTENGYREKVESDNPPASQYDGTYRYRQDQDRADGYQQSGGGQNQSGADDYSRGTYGKMPYGENGYGYQNRREEKKKNNMSSGTIILLVVLGILASPVIIALAAAAVGVAVGILGALFGVVVAILAAVVALFAAGIALFVMGFPILFSNPFAGMLCIAFGCLLIALFLLLVIALVAIFGKFFPWLIHEVESFGKYLSGKWAERKKKGAQRA